MIRFGIPDRYVTHGKPDAAARGGRPHRGAHRRARAGRAGPPRVAAQRVAMGTDIGQWAVHVLEQGCRRCPPLEPRLRPCRPPSSAASVGGCCSCGCGRTAARHRGCARAPAPMGHEEVAQLEDGGERGVERPDGAAGTGGTAIRSYGCDPLGSSMAGWRDGVRRRPAAASEEVASDRSRSRGSASGRCRWNPRVEPSWWGNRLRAREPLRRRAGSPGRARPEPRAISAGCLMGWPGLPSRDGPALRYR